MTDNFSNYLTGLNSPGREAAAVTPNDSADLPTVARALYIGVGGTLKITTPMGSDVSFTVVAGPFPMGAKRVWATGTAATNIVAMW